MARSYMHFSERMIPLQPEFSIHYAGSRETLARRLFDTAVWTSGIRMPAEDFDLVPSDRFSQEEMGSDPIAQRLLDMLIVMNRAKSVLEIGTFIGVTTMYMARALRSGGSVVTIEKFDEFAAIARENFRRNGFQDRIQLIVGDASKEIRKFDASARFDLVFIDGNKEKYHEYFELLEPHLSESGVMVIDDCFFLGDALNDAPVTEKGRGVKSLLELVSKREELLRLALPVADGILIIKRI